MHLAAGDAEHQERVRAGVAGIDRALGGIAAARLRPRVLPSGVQRVCGPVSGHPGGDAAGPGQGRREDEPAAERED